MKKKNTLHVNEIKSFFIFHKYNFLKNFLVREIYTVKAFKSTTIIKYLLQIHPLYREKFILEIILIKNVIIDNFLNIKKLSTVTWFEE